MKLIDALPRNQMDKILLKPADSKGNEGTVDEEWFESKFATLSNAEVPLSDSNFNKLKSIDRFWEENAKKWRSKGLI